MSDEVITIAGKAVSIRAWSVGKQLAAAFAHMEADDLKLEHKMALAFNAGYEAAKTERQFPDLSSQINMLDEVADRLRQIHRKS
jgi:hypothetical protein